MDLSINNNFELNYEQIKTVFLMEYQLVVQDIKLEKKSRNCEMKQKWLDEWLADIKDFLLKIKDDKNDSNGYEVFDEKTNLAEALSDICKKSSINKLPLFLMLLEVILFKAYFPLNKQKGSEGKINKFVSDVKSMKESFIDLQYLEDEMENELIKYAVWMELNPNCIKDLKKSYEEAISGIMGANAKIVTGVTIIGLALIGVAIYVTPSIRTLFGKVGIAGTIAISSGVVAICGAIIVISGFGGGKIALVSSGEVLLGNGAMKSSSKITLLQAAKVEVVMKDVLLKSQGNESTVKELIKTQRTTIAVLENKLIDMQTDSNVKREELENLKKSIGYLKNALSRGEYLLKNQKINKGKKI